MPIRCKFGANTVDCARLAAAAAHRDAPVLATGHTSHLNLHHIFLVAVHVCRGLAVLLRLVVALQLLLLHKDAVKEDLATFY